MGAYYSFDAKNIDNSFIATVVQSSHKIFYLFVLKIHFIPACYRESWHKICVFKRNGSRSKRKCQTQGEINNLKYLTSTSLQRETF